MKRFSHDLRFHPISTVLRLMEGVARKTVTPKGVSPKGVARKDNPFVLSLEEGAARGLHGLGAVGRGHLGADGDVRGLLGGDGVARRVFGEEGNTRGLRGVNGDARGMHEFNGDARELHGVKFVACGLHGGEASRVGCIVAPGESFSLFGAPLVLAGAATPASSSSASSTHLHTGVQVSPCPSRGIIRRRNWLRVCGGVVERERRACSTSLCVPGSQNEYAQKKKKKVSIAGPHGRADSPQSCSRKLQTAVSPLDIF